MAVQLPRRAVLGVGLSALTWTPSRTPARPLPDVKQRDELVTRVPQRNGGLYDVLLIADNDSRQQPPCSVVSRLQLIQQLPSLPAQPATYILAQTQGPGQEPQLQRRELQPLLTAFGRGGEFSDLLLLDANTLLTFDDHTGVIYQLASCNPPLDPTKGVKSWDHWMLVPGTQQTKIDLIPRWVLADADGEQPRPFKTEWAAVKDGQLFVGSHGHDLGYDSSGPTRCVGPKTLTYVKSINVNTGQVKHLDWTHMYNAINNKLGITFPGYVTHEAVVWSRIQQRWYFMPRRVCKTAYDPEVEVRSGVNIIVSCKHDGTDVKVVQLQGKTDNTRGFSACRFIPGTDDTHIVALKTVEGTSPTDPFQSYITVMDTLGKVLLEETLISNSCKFEGIEVVAARDTVSVNVLRA